MRAAGSRAVALGAAALLGLAGTGAARADVTSPPPPPPMTVGAVESCVSAMERALDETRVQTASESRLTPMRRAFATCAKLYRPACRAAMERFAAAAGTAADVAEICARDYCPTLVAPKPALCAETPPPSALLAAWPELQAAIWRAELGDARLQKLAPRMQAIATRSRALVDELARARVVLQTPPRSAPARAAGVVPVVHVTRDGAWLIAGDARTLAARRGGALDRAALQAGVRAWRASGRFDADAEVAADDTVAYVDVITVLDVLIANGFANATLRDPESREPDAAQKVRGERPIALPARALPIGSAPRLLVSRAGMELDGKPLPLPPPGDSSYEPLARALADARARIDASALPPDDKRYVRQALVLVISKEIPMPVVKRILYTAGVVGFTDVNFAVTKTP
jgi:biopolymer transport protein ExbD